jgi:RNA polymerase sigma-70 factor (ECF subfamily)
MDDLLRRCFEGDRTAWAEFVQRYTPVIYSGVAKTVAAHVPGAPREMIEDIVQDVFLRMLNHDMKNLRAHDPARAKLSTWLTIVARTTAIDCLRRRKHHDEPLEDQLIFQAAPDEASPEPEDPIRLPKGLLSERQELVLHLTFDGNKPVEEIAALMGVTEQTVRSTRNKAITKLRAFMKKAQP